MRRLRLVLLASASLALFGSTYGAGAQIPPDIPLVDRVGVGARAMGMAGAYSALADDATALYYNPAALARVERIELAATISYHRIQDETTFLGRRNARDINPTRINHLGFAYPFPTYRGSLVVGMAFNRLADLDRDFLRMGRRSGVIEDVESIIESGSFNAWTGGVGWDASQNVSVGASATLLVGTSFREREYHYENVKGDFEHSYVADDTDITGVSGTLGALVRLGRGGRFSLSIDLPRSITLEGSASEDILRYDGGTDTLDVFDDFFYEDDITLPFSTTVGLAWRFGDFTASTDLQFTDWTDIDYEGPLRTPPPERELAYREVLTVRLGGELAPREWPVRVRAGFAYDPVPYRIIITDVFTGDYEAAEYSPERYELSFGAGALLEQSFTVDMAYTHRWFEREGTGIIEGRDEDKVFLGAGFRF